MTRILLPALLLTVIFSTATAVLAQEPKWELWGRVLRADTGLPLRAAKVSYRGEGDTRDSAGRVMNPPTLQGEVTTGEDGEYKVTQLPPGPIVFVQ